MQCNHAEGHHIVATCERCIGHVAAIVVGFLLMLSGVAMGVTIVLLPYGIPVGFAGLFLFMWGFFSAAPKSANQSVPAPRQNV